MTSRPSRARRVLFGATTLALVGGVLFVALEALCRLADPLGISYYPETARWLDTFLVRDPIGYWHRPHTSGRFFGASIRINSLGLRGPEIPPKQPGEVRILLMGDSFPFGIGVAEDQAFPAVLERLLDADASPGTDYRVINMGVVSYNSEQELRQLQELGLALRPDAVVLAWALNDIEPAMWVFHKRRGRVVNVAQRSYAASLLTFLARTVQYKLFGFSGIAVGEFRPDSPRWQAVDRSLTQMHRLCRDAGIPFVVFVYDEKFTDATGLVHGVGAREGFPVLDVFPSRHARWGKRNPRELANSALDSHPNVEGNRMWGELLHDALTAAHVHPAWGRLSPAPSGSAAAAASAADRGHASAEAAP